MQNIGNVDRVSRFIAGIALIAGAIVLTGLWRVMAIPGVVLIGTAVVRVCPMYLPFRIRTNRAGR